MTALSCKRGGSRRRRKQGKRGTRRTHRKGGARRKRQMGGNVKRLYFYEAFAENIVNRIADKNGALKQEKSSGFLSNYYTRFRDGLPQDSDKDLKKPAANARFVQTNIRGFYYKGHWFATSEQALCFAKADFFDPNHTNPHLFEKILTTHNPDKIKTIGSSLIGLTEAGPDGIVRTYKITFARRAEDETRFCVDINPVSKRPTPDAIAYVNSLFRDWGLYNYDVMFNVQMAKFRVVFDNAEGKWDDEMYTLLKNTGQRYLAEAAPGDAIWGIGYSENGLDPDDDVSLNENFSAETQLRWVDGIPKWPILTFEEKVPGSRVWTYVRDEHQRPVYKTDGGGNLIYAENRLGNVLMDVRKILNDDPKSMMEKKDPPIPRALDRINVAPQ